MIIEPVGFFSQHLHHSQAVARLLSLIALLAGICFGAACGNKGALYLVPDDESLQELEQAEQEINQAAQLSGTEEPADSETSQEEDEEGEEGEEESEDESSEKDTNKQPSS